MDERETNVTIVKNDQWFVNGLKYLVMVAVYCAIGWSIDSWLFVPEGGLTDWTVPGTYLVIAFWPFILIWEFLKLVFWVVLAILISFIIHHYYKRLRG